MDKDFFEIDGSHDTFVSFDCTPKKCSVQVHAKPMDAVCICGAATVSAIETYFNLAKEADIPKEVAWKPMRHAIESALENVGFDVDIDAELSEDED